MGGEGEAAVEGNPWSPWVAMWLCLFSLSLEHLPGGLLWMLSLEAKHPKLEQAKRKPQVDASCEWACFHISSWVHELSMRNGPLGEGLLWSVFKFFSCRSGNNCIFILIYV